MIRRDSPSFRWLSVLFCFLIMILPMANWLSALRPFFLALVLIFWILETPQKISLGRVFCIGLVLDIFSFTFLGEHALRLLIICGVVHQFRNQFRFYPLWQQSVLIMILLYFDQLVLWFIRYLQGMSVPVIETLASPFIAFLIWPWLYIVLDNWRLQIRTQ